MTALQQAMADAQRKLDAAPKPQEQVHRSERQRLWDVLNKHPKGLLISELITKFKFTESAARSGQRAMEATGCLRTTDERAIIGGRTHVIKRLHAVGDACLLAKPGRQPGQKYPKKTAAAPGTAFATGAVSVPASALPGPALADVGSMTVAQLQQMAENGRKAQAILADAAKLYAALGKILNG